MGAEQTSEETAGVAPPSRASSVDPRVVNTPDLSFGAVGTLGELGATGSRDARLDLQRGAGNAHVARLLRREERRSAGLTSPRRRRPCATPSWRTSTPMKRRGRRPGSPMGRACGSCAVSMTANWSSPAGLTPASPRSRAAFSRVTPGPPRAPSRGRACRRSLTTPVFDVEAEQVAKDHQTTLTPAAEQLDTSRPLGFKPRFQFARPSRRDETATTPPTTCASGS